MAVPFYVCGLAEPGKDGPFHDLETSLKASREFHTSVTGRDAANLMSDISGTGLHQLQQQLQPQVFPIPFACPGEFRAHLKKCGRTCAHDKHCANTECMWRTLGEQAPKAKPYAGELSDGLAQHLIDFYDGDTEQLRIKLEATLRSHADIILDRWKKMSLEERGMLLAKVSPSVFGTWPLEIGVCGSKGCYEEHFKYWQGGAWLNLRDMAGDWMKLISALHVRTRHAAAAWTMFDTRAGIKAWAGDCPLLSAWYNSSCVYMSGNDYGTLANFDAALTHQWAMSGLPRALLIFQSQHELMYTLQDILTNIIDGSDGTGASMWDSLITEGLHSAGQDVSWNAYTHQAFTDPVPFSPNLLATKAEDRLRMVKDEIFMMRADPAYMQAIITTKSAAINNISSDLGREDQLHLAATLFIGEHFNRYIIWQTIASRCHELAKTFEHYGSRCEAGKIMPSEVGHQMTALGMVLDGSYVAAGQNFEKIAHSTQALQHRFKLFQSEGQLHIREKQTKLDQSKPVDRLRWRLSSLLKEVSNRPSLGHSTMFESAMREEESARIMDKPTREFFSDMMIADDIRTSLSHCQRGKDVRGVDDGLPKRRVEMEKICIHHDPECRQPQLKFDNQWQERLAVLVQNFMDAPWPKGRRSLSWLAKANVTRERLALLWRGVAAEFETAEANGGSSSACGKSLIASIISFDTDTTHLEALEAERVLCEEESRKIRAAADEDAKSLQNYTSQTEWGSTPVVPCHHKAKNTTSAPALPIHPRIAKISDSNIKAHAANEELPKVEVNKESMAIFAMMYRSDSECLAGGTIRWQAFVQAMQDAGFTAQEASGSAVTFKDQSGGRICFHRPHPEPVLDPIMLYSMAKRMNKWFGFEADRFVLREKGTDTGST